MTTPVSLQLAKLLKEKGFDLECKHIRDLYNSEEAIEMPTCKDWNFQYSMLESYSAPAIGQVIMWLYEKYNIWLWVGCTQMEFEGAKQMFICSARYIPTKRKRGFEFDPILYQPKESPTEAYEAGINYVLENLI